MPAAANPAAVSRVLSKNNFVPFEPDPRFSPKREIPLGDTTPGYRVRRLPGSEAVSEHLRGSVVVTFETTGGGLSPAVEESATETHLSAYAEALHAEGYVTERGGLFPHPRVLFVTTKA